MILYNVDSLNVILQTPCVQHFYIHIFKVAIFDGYSKYVVRHTIPPPPPFPPVDDKNSVMRYTERTKVEKF